MDDSFTPGASLHLRPIDCFVISISIRFHDNGEDHQNLKNKTVWSCLFMKDNVNCNILAIPPGDPYI